MAKRVLVPLDQSSLAESVLPVVADLARGADSAVRLLYVAPTPTRRSDSEGRVVAYADQEMSRLQSEATDYLETVELQFKDLAVDSAVRFGDAVQEIQAEAQAWGADLIAVTTSGRSGLRRAVLGSVAEQVFRKARGPVMLYSPFPER